MRSLVFLCHRQRYRRNRSSWTNNRFNLPWRYSVWSWYSGCFVPLYLNKYITKLKFGKPNKRPHKKPTIKQVSSRYWTLSDLHFESAHCEATGSAKPTIVPVNLYRKMYELGKESLSSYNCLTALRYLLSGDSSPSNTILNLFPTVSPWFIDSKYLLTPIINWLVLQNNVRTCWAQATNMGNKEHETHLLLKITKPRAIFVCGKKVTLACNKL